MPALAYFGALGALLGIIWFFQMGEHQRAAAAGGASGGDRRATSEGGGEGDIPEAPKPLYGSYQYNYGEQPGQDTSSAYAGSTDNATTTIAGPGTPNLTLNQYNAWLTSQGLPTQSYPTTITSQTAPAPIAQVQPPSTYIPGTSSAGGGGATRL